MHIHKQKLHRIEEITIKRGTQKHEKNYYVFAFLE